MQHTGYRGRFAPSPTGPLHLGSLLAAVASYADARANNGAWLVRIEDLDRPREVTGAAADIIATLAAFGFAWDETIVYQSQRTAAYHEALDRLGALGLTYPCGCSRTEIARLGPPYSTKPSNSVTFGCRSRLIASLSSSTVGNTCNSTPTLRVVKLCGVPEVIVTPALPLFCALDVPTSLRISP